jgi:hypothetical protein
MANLYDPIMFGCRTIHSATHVQLDQMKITDPVHSVYRPLFVPRTKPLGFVGLPLWKQT